MDSDSESDLDSLFDEIPTESNELISYSAEGNDPEHIELAHLTPPSIDGLYFDPSICLPPEYTSTLFQKCLQTYFTNSNVNQVMLFERVSLNVTEPKEPSSPNSKLPTFLTELLITLSSILRPCLPISIHSLLFPSQSASPKARQVIINHYLPGEGITPHVDLLDRFGDGIIGVSLGGSCVMRFRKVDSKEVGLRSGYHQSDEPDSDEVENVYLPAGSVYVMSGDARYGWTHGIERRRADRVQDDPDDGEGRWIKRSVRVSITFRWLLPGADIVGTTADS